ncbi:MAG: SPOR domain-containing protein, partial [Pseudomonadota bacterium]|nr:SPOR domain-containing protein [Pseudomonadota bacterium]
EQGAREEVSGRRYLQVGAFSELRSAQRVFDQLRQLTRHPVFIRSVKNSSGNVLYRVRVGPMLDIRELRELSERVVAANLGSPYTVTE